MGFLAPDFFGLFALLRFEPNLLLALFFSEH
jgi:hypothetical protein